MPRPGSRRASRATLRVSPSDYYLQVDHPSLGRVQSDATIAHRLAYSAPHFFCQGPFLWFGFLHAFSLRTTAEGLAWSQFAKRWRLDGNAPDPTKAEERQLWAPLAPLGDVAPKSHRIYTRQRLLVARVLVQEIPSTRAGARRRLCAGL
jgi:hypothetical protein